MTGRTRRPRLINETLLQPTASVIVPSIRPICVREALTRSALLWRASIAEAAADATVPLEAPGAEYGVVAAA